MPAPRPSAPPWADVKLHISHGPTPEAGTELVTPSGRRYQVIGLRGRKTLHCIVLPPEAPPGDPVWRWTWDAKNKRREP